MISLVDYINESLLEESFFDYDTALDKVQANMQDVEKLKILIKKFSQFGEEEEYGENEEPYDKLLRSLKNSLSEKKFAELKDIEKSVAYDAPYKDKLAARVKYCDKMFAAIKSSLDKNARKYGYSNYEYLITALVGCADYIEHYSSLEQKDADKYLGKLSAKFNKVFGVDANGFTKISKLYDKLKVDIKTAVDLETKTVESVKDIKNAFKDHKYTLFASANYSSAQMFIINNSDYESLDDAFDSTVAKEGSGSPMENYNLENMLRYLVKEGKVKSLYLCSGNYCWGKNENEIIPKFGYLDEIPSDEIYKHSKYDNKFYYCGKLRSGSPNKNQGKIAYQWYDNLWMQHTK